MKVTNFRKFQESPWIDLKAINFFVGTNGSGKSTMVKAYHLVYLYLKANKLFEIDFSDELFLPLHIQSFDELKPKHGKSEEICKIELKVDEVEFELHLEQHEQASFAKVAYFKMNALREKVKYEFFQNKSLARLSGYDKQIKITFYNNKRYEDEVKNDLEIRFSQEKSASIKKDLREYLGYFGKETKKSSDREEFDSKSPILMERGLFTNDSFDDFLKQFDISPLKPNQEVDEYVYDSNHAGVSHRFDNEIIGSFKYFMNYFSYTNKWNSDYQFDYKFSSYLENKMEINKNAIVAHYRLNEYFHGLGMAQFIVELALHDMPLRLRKYNRLLKISDKTDDLAQLIHRYQTIKTKKGVISDEFIKKWMSYNFLNLGDDFKIELVYDDSYFVSINEAKISINELGSGQIQLMKILFQLGIILKEDRPSSILLIEEPELNLHPSMQSKLGDLFYDAYLTMKKRASREVDPIQLLIETHSEYLIRRIQVLIGENQLKDHPFSVHYFPSTNEEDPYELKINAQGVMDRDFGKGFFDEASNHTLKLIKLQFEK